MCYQELETLGTITTKNPTYVLQSCPPFTNYPVYSCVGGNISDAVFDALLCETTPSQ